MKKQQQGDRNSVSPITTGAEMTKTAMDAKHNQTTRSVTFRTDRFFV